MKRRQLLTFLMALLILVPATSSASSVIQVTFNDLVLSSELIFEGRVVDKRAEMSAGGTIHTYVTFRIQDVIKGSHSDSQIVLRYQGGTVGALTLEVSDLVVPGIGETGIYFVESTTRPLVHPLYGWDQGHFVVMTAGTDRTERVFSRNLKPVAGIQQTDGKASGLSNGIASGLQVAEPDRRNEAMSVSTFRQKVREIVAKP